MTPDLLRYCLLCIHYVIKIEIILKNIAQKCSLYIAIVRSLFEHCGEIWGPNLATTINKFKPIPKIAVKWILAEGNKKYSEQKYHSKLHKLELLPLHYFFAVKKLKLFHYIVNETSCITMPAYLIKKLTSRTVDNSYNFEISPRIKLPIIRSFGSSFFPPNTELWNSLLFDVKSTSTHYHFLTELKRYFWSKIITEYEFEPD